MELKQKKLNSILKRLIKIFKVNFKQEKMKAIYLILCFALLGLSVLAQTNLKNTPQNIRIDDEMLRNESFSHSPALKNATASKIDYNGPDSFLKEKIEEFNHLLETKPYLGISESKYLNELSSIISNTSSSKSRVVQKN